VNFSNKVRIGLLIMIVAGLVVLQPLSAQTVTLKVASLAPENSEYGRVLSQINQDWIKKSGGKVRMQIIHNGSAGDENQVRSLISQGVLQGGLFSSVGLGKISLPVITMSAPLLIKTNAQMKYILQQIKPDLDKSFLDKGYQPIAYARGGWVYVFGRKPIHAPSDLKVQKIAIQDSDEIIFSALQGMNYNPVSVSPTAQAMALNSGVIDAYLSSPLIVVTQAEALKVAKNIMDMPFAPFIGGLLIDKRAWNRVPAEFRQTLIDDANQIVSGQLEPALERVEKDAITNLKKAGYIVDATDPSLRAAWGKEFESGLQKILDKGGFDQPTYQRIKTLLANFKE